MKRFRLRLSWLLWLVAIAAAFLAGVRYGEYRAGPRPPYLVHAVAFPPARQSSKVVLPPAEVADSVEPKPVNSHAGP
jgi:hypothetical protein